MITNTSKSIIILITFLCTYSTSSFSKEPARVIAGWVEKVRIEYQAYDIKAKLDTGAKTSSIHAIKIKPFKKDGKRWVKFTLLLKDSKGTQHKLYFEKPRSRKANIKNHNGKHDPRYVVNLDLCFNGRKYVTEFTLADRSEYIYDVLLGRQFLKRVAVIDPNDTFLTLSSCEAQSNQF
ncbi:MAG: ATP-dependent zinc protease [Gammaproteobacteria bacterium]|nr:ATP-dependent zinc protease [Gammaproteobacteria bacterium]